MTAGWRWSDK